MKNITVSLDDETYRRARMRAAQRDSSVSAMVRQFLIGIAAGETEAEWLAHEEERLRAQVRVFRAADRLQRDALHDRDR